MRQALKDVDSLIVRYLDNEATYEEKAKLSMWLNFSEENKRYFIRMIKTWERSHIYLQDEERASERFTHLRQLLFRRKVRRVVYGSSAAAAIVLLLLAVRFFMPLSGVSLLTAATSDQKKEVVLPDGSIVWLNRNSTIQYPENFTSYRKVYLNGEAYFDVTNNKEQPFIVETSDLTIQVLGTQFLVTNYSEEMIAEAVLESGTIQLMAGEAGEEFLLHPNQMFTYDKALGETRLESVDATNFTDWINSRLVFENTRLTDVFTQLEKWYGIRIECKDAGVLQTPVSFTIDTETKEEILNILQAVVPFNWKQKQLPGQIQETIAIFQEVE
ncbi:FecR domain-containing protein [Proteiniphilum sp.]|uniref:FecR family protein n=1 Tax=Proteiniphilum sp. TaxID=1926877 RepID=UPI0033326056